MSEDTNVLNRIADAIEALLELMRGRYTNEQTTINDQERIPDAPDDRTGAKRRR
jgi:hypothetical protein